jgi:hypothetical protein
MAFRVSPGVSIKEIDLTTIVPAVATTPGGYAGYFHWGPADEIVTVTQQTELANIFGKPRNDNYTDFFTVGNFLGYGNNMQVVRVVPSNALNAASTKGYVVSPTGKLIKNQTDFLAGVTNGDNTILFSAKYPGVLGNSLKVVAVSGAGLQNGLTLAAAASLGGTSVRVNLPVASAIYLSVGDEVVFHDGTQATVSGVANSATARGATAGDFFGVCGAATGLTLSLSTPLTSNYSAGYTLAIKSVYSKYVTTTATTTEFASAVAGSGDLVSILVLDKNGQWTGTENTLLEKFEGVSRAFDARAFDGSSNYYKTVVNDRSAYVWALSNNLNSNGLSAATSTFPNIGTTLDPSSTVGSGVNAFHLGGGTAGVPTDSDRWIGGWSKFQDADAVDVSLLPLGAASNNLSRLVVQNVCEKRLDCMAFVSPAQTDVENKLPYEALNNIKTFRDNLNINSSYAVIDSGWKYQLDTYNNVVRVMPLNGDIAGLVARTEFTNEAWFSPAGFNRGQIKGVVKLAYNPSSEAHRDELYTRQVNPVVSFPGEGVILFGDKTAQTRPSAFDRINVRRLFIILEKAIATASKFFLFEQNDSFTRAQFKNLVTPFLKTVQQRRGITDFKVVCDETNNTGEIIDRNEFVADIFIKPTRSINFISLNFIATKTGVSFSEVGG